MSRLTSFINLYGYRFSKKVRYIYIHIQIQYVSVTSIISSINQLYKRGGGQKYGQITCLGKKNIERGEKIIERGGKGIIFPLLVKSMHIFSSIDLKFTRLPKKRLKIINFIRGKNINNEGGGAKN